MSKFTWIKLSVFVMLPLQFAAVTGQSTAAKAGDDVTLPCNSLVDDLGECEQTSWLYSPYIWEAAGELVSLGQISKNGESDRLNMTANCSLVIKNVTVEDVGWYTCRQFNKSGEKPGRDAVVVLSVVILDEHQNNDTVTFFCSALTHGACGHTVQWLYEGGDGDVDTVQHPCAAWATFPTHLIHKSENYKLPKCSVTDNKSGKMLLYDVGTQKTGSFGRNTTSSAKSDTQGLWRIIMVSVCLGTLIITVVSVNIWTRLKGNKTQREQLNDEDADEGTVTYANVGEPSAAVRLH